MIADRIRMNQITTLRSNYVENRILAPARELVDQVESLAVEARAVDNGPRDLDSRPWRIRVEDSALQLQVEIRSHGDNPMDGVMRLEAHRDGLDYHYHREGYDQVFSCLDPQGQRVFPKVVVNDYTGTLTVLDEAGSGD